MRGGRGAMTIVASALVVCACGSNGSGASGGVGANGDGGGDASLPSSGTLDASSMGPPDGATSGDAPTGDADSSSGDGSVDGTTPGDASGADGADADGATDATGVDAVVVDGATDAAGSCLTSSTQIAIVQTATGCSFPYTGAQPAGAMNLYLTPGWGTVCFAGGSTGCGTGSGADGWWFSGPQEIAVCDATCTRFYNQTIAGKLTVQLGCPTEMCMH